MSQIRPTAARVDGSALRGNAQLLAQHSGAKICAVIKADGYGHGAVAAASTLQGVAEVGALAVSLVEEALELRAAGITLPILIMGPSLGPSAQLLVQHNFIAVVSELAWLRAQAPVTNGVGQIHLKVNTGMNRLGLSLEELPLAVELAHAAGLTVSGISTHFANSDLASEEDARFSCEQQNARFVSATTGFSGLRHVANTGAILRFGREFAYDWIRPGLALYGNGSWMAPSLGLRQVMTLRSEIVQLRTVKMAEKVGYGGTWQAPRDTRVAVCHIGYADGVPRRLTGKGKVLIRGQRCAILGVVSMDILVVDVSGLAEPRVGEEIVLFGEQAGAVISVAEFGKWAGLTEYEVTCGITRRVPRDYV